jgi:immune inhibitor A
LRNKLLAVMSALVLLVSLAGTTMAAKHKPQEKIRMRGDNLPGVLAKKQSLLKEKAQGLVLEGDAKATGKNKVVRVSSTEGGGKGSDSVFVELAFEGEDQILTLLGEFGNGQPTHTHATDINHGGTDGPLHNQIPEPNRLGVDNSTIWTANFSKSYYDKLLFDQDFRPSMANWYLEQSSGRFTVDGYVSNWVKVPNNEAAYGSNYCGDIVCTRDIGRFIEDQADTWWDTLVAQKGSVAAANFFLSKFDVWDRYDFDEDGDFDEPDGYIDHFQSVHAGDGEETGGGAQGTDAIWSHRSYVNSIAIGADGPPGGPDFGGAQIGGSNYWIGDYTIEPENGGVGVFAHEFGHDLGLPDEYDTSGNTGGAENSTGWWTPWSQGSYGTISQDLGSFPVSSSAWEKLQLGWLNYDVAFAGVNKQKFTLGPSEYNNVESQAVVVILPQKTVVTNVGTPFAGSWFYHSGSGNDLDNTMTRQVTLPAGSVSATFQARYHIEPCWDYAYLQVSTDGTTFTNVHTSASTDTNPNGQNFGEGITGVSGTPLNCETNTLAPTPTWQSVTADLSAWAGQQVWLRFRYWTDAAAAGDGISIDNLAITGSTTDGAETDPGWTYDGFFRTTGTVSTKFNHYYIAEFRQYWGYDRALKRGPYSFTDPAGNWVEHFPYQDGLLVWYWDTSQDDNNVGDHPGKGLILPIDAHPKILHWSDGSVARPRIQAYDSTFGIWKTDAITLHRPGFGGVLDVKSKAAHPIFDDMKSYWRSNDPADPAGNAPFQSEWSSVRNPHTGTTIKVLGVFGNGRFMNIRVN